MGLADTRAGEQRAGAMFVACAMRAGRAELRLPWARAAWQGRDMPRKRPSAAGGALIALGALAGFVIGYVERQPVAGLVIGVAAGAALAIAIWLRDRR